MEKEVRDERFPASVSVALLLTHGKAGRLLLTRNTRNGTQAWGPIAGGVEKGETAWGAGLREAKEEANISPENIIFVKGRNQLEPHVALVRKEEKISLGLIFDVTYSGPVLPLDEGWKIKEDSDVDMARFFKWQEVLVLLESQNQLYLPEFNAPQLLRWIIAKPKRTTESNEINEWLINNMDQFPGLKPAQELKNDLSLKDCWIYHPPYNDWMNSPFIHGDPAKTNFARRRFLGKE